MGSFNLTLERNLLIFSTSYFGHKMWQTKTKKKSDLMFPVISRDQALAARAIYGVQASLAF